ncbi:MAG: hypothetical protein AAFX93_02660 [Verrucomicrobiota bacterium]
MDILEFIVPIVVFVIWIIGQVVGKQSGESTNESSQEQSPYTPLDHPANEDEERKRRIQEEIRRKIAERRGQDPNLPPPQQPAAPPSLPHTAQATPPPMQPPPAQPEPPAFPPPITSSTEPQFVEVPVPQRNYEAELEEQRRAVEEAMRRADEINAEAKRRVRDAYDQSKPARRTPRSYAGASLSRRVRGKLRDPLAAREAFVYLEVLGTPVGQRERGSMKPSWES